MLKKFTLITYIDPTVIHLPDTGDLYSAKDYYLEPLKSNIARCGVLSPLIIRTDENGRREVVCGKKRLLCARLLRMKTVPCVKINCTKREAAILRLSEMMTMGGADYFEVADSLSDLITNHAFTIASAAEALGITQNVIKEKLKLIDFPFELRAKAAESLTEAQVLSLMILPATDLAAALDEVIERGLNEPQTKSFVNDYFTPKKAEPVRKAAIADIRIFSNSLEKLLFTLKNAGYETDFSIEDENRFINYRIKIKKKAEQLSYSQMKIC